MPPIDLKKQKTVGETLYGEYTAEHDMGFQFVVRARYHDDEISIVLKGHLLVEYLIDRIIISKFSKSKTRSTFSRKALLLFETGHIKDHLYNNLKILNTLRNQLAHELDFEIPEENMIFHKDTGEKIQVLTKRRRNKRRFYCRLLCNGILSELRNHMMLVLHIDPRWLGCET